MDQLRPTIFAGLLILLAVASPQARAETGVGPDSILFGQAAALDGPSSALGQGMRQGILAAFAEINAKGGVHGRKLSLVSRDVRHQRKHHHLRPEDAGRAAQGFPDLRPAR